ncbi:hypothetical protein [Mesoflavibacter zeaxanthinifaciens]|uniref:hypothetical protein n=1 Tax=Mesoflavibacter zeaxanthinifaciens TaxID=393060 RepID=UPI003A8E709A
MKQLIVFTPKEVDIDKILKENELDLNADYLKHFISYVLNGLARFVEHYDKKTGEYIRLRKKYVKLNSKRDVLNKNIHKKHADFLVSNFEPFTYRLSRTTKGKKLISILYRKPYVEKKKSYSYRINPNYSKQELKVNYIKSSSFRTKIREYSTQIPPVLKTGKYRFLNKYFENEKLDIDFDKALQLCNKRFHEQKDYGKYLNEIYKIVDLKNKIYRVYYHEDTDARLHTNITMLNKVYRKYLTYNNKKLVEVDLSNSIIYFLTMLICNNNITDNNHLNNNILLLKFQESLKSLSIKEIDLVKKIVVNGEFYDYFIDDIVEYFEYDELKVLYNKDNEENYSGSRTEIRKIAKKNILAMIFADPRSKNYTKFRKIFKNKFPELLAVLNRFKIENGKKQLSHLLFQIESYYVLDVVARDFNKKYSKTAPIFSLHDCLITTEDFASELKKTFEVVLNRELANKPMTKITKW